MNFSFRCRLFQEALFSPSLERLCIVFPRGLFPADWIYAGAVYIRKTERNAHSAFSLLIPGWLFPYAHR